MNDSSRSMSVLQKILKEGKEAPQKPNSSTREELIQDFWRPKAQPKIIQKKPGRPKISDDLKARNFTLCLAPKYLSFLDKMQLKDTKIKGRGRKIRFIIDQFIELNGRQKSQLLILKEGLVQVEKVLQGFSDQVKKGQKLNLAPKEKAQITAVVNQVKILLKVLTYTPKELHKLLPRHEWALVSFCLNWSDKSGENA
jgi:hypothetical protein